MGKLPYSGKMLGSNSQSLKYQSSQTSSDNARTGADTLFINIGTIAAGTRNGENG